MTRTRFLSLLITLAMLLTACFSDSTRTPLPFAATPSAAPMFTQAPVRDAHRIIDLGGEAFPRLAWSADSRYLAIGTDETFTIWDVESDPPQLVLDKPDFKQVIATDFNPNGRLISLIHCMRPSPDRGCDLLIWDWTADQVVETLTVRADYDMAWSPEGDMLAYWSAGRDRILFWADPASGAEAPNGIKVPPVGSAKLVWLPNDTYRMMTVVDKAVGIWNSYDADAIHEFPNASLFDLHEDEFSADGLRSVTRNTSGDALVVWNAADGSRLQTIPFPNATADHFAINADGSRIATASFDEASISLFDVATGGLIATLPGAGTALSAELSFSPDGRTLAASYDTGEIHLWDVPSVQTAAATLTPIPSPTPRPTLAAAPQTISFPAPLPETSERGLQVLGGGWADNQTLQVNFYEFGSDGERAIYYPQQIMDVDLATQSQIAIREVTTVTLSPDGTQYLNIISKAEGSAQVIDVQTGEVVFELPYSTYLNQDYTWSPDQRYLLNDMTTTIEVYDAQDGTYLGDLPNPDSSSDVYYRLPAFSPDGKWLAVLNDSRDPGVVVWDLDTLQIAHAVEKPDDSAFYQEHVYLQHALWTQDSSRLLINWSGWVEGLAAGTWQPEFRLMPEINGEDIALDIGLGFRSPDGEWLIHRAYFLDKFDNMMLYAWNVNTLEQRILMQYVDANTGFLGHNAWHPTRPIFATADYKGRVYVASMDGAMLRLDTSYDIEPVWLGWSPDGRSLGSITQDGWIQVWTFDALP